MRNQRVYSLEYYHRNREVINARRRNRYSVDPRIKEMCTLRRKRFNLKHPSSTRTPYPLSQEQKKRITIYRRNRYHTNFKYRESEKKRLRLYALLRIHNKRTSGKITKGMVGELLRLSNYSCAICGKKDTVVKLSIDHVIPVILGGTNDFSNLQILCLLCNKRKGGRLHQPSFS